MTQSFSTNITQVEHQFSGNQFVLGPLNLVMNSGDCLGIMGQNGAGKSTLFQIITGNLKPIKGELNILDERMFRENFLLKRKIGYLPQNLELPNWVTANELLAYASSLYSLPDSKPLIQETLDKWDCAIFSSKPLATCSHGMKKRVALGLATIHNPPLLILDEPFSGLDLFHIKALQDEILLRQSRGQLTILCTHIAPYTAKLCNRAMTLSHGQLTEVSSWKEQNYLTRVETIENIFYQKADKC